MLAQMIKSISHMKNIFWAKLGFSSGDEGRRLGKEEDVISALTGKPNVNEEYKRAFRTKSYTEICNKVQCELEIKTNLDERYSSSSSSSSPLSPLPSSPAPAVAPIHMSEYLLEPRQETLISICESSNLHQCLVSYFQISLEAGRICEVLLQEVHQVRIYHRAIDDVLELIKRVPNGVSWTNSQYHKVYRNLASFALCRNPFSTITPAKFHELHDTHIFLLHQLTTLCRKTERRTKFMRFIKRALAKQKSNRTWLEGLGAQLDIAARGVYILTNDFDTMSRLVQRLHDEMEHRKFVVDICVRKGKNEMLKQVVREFQMHEAWFLEQLEELEKQVYLCFLDINRSRRLVVQEMV